MGKGAGKSTSNKSLTKTYKRTACPKDKLKYKFILSRMCSKWKCLVQPKALENLRKLFFWAQFLKGRLALTQD